MRVSCAYLLRALADLYVAADSFETSRTPKHHRLRQDLPLLLMNPLAQRFGGVVAVHVDGRLQNDRPAICFTRLEELGRAAGDSDTVIEGVLDGVHATAE